MFKGKYLRHMEGNKEGFSSKRLDQSVGMIA